MNTGLFRSMFKEIKLKLSYPRPLIYQELSNLEKPLSPKSSIKPFLKKGRESG